MRGISTRAATPSDNGSRKPRPSINTRANLSRVGARTARMSSPAASPAISPAAPSTFDSFLNSTVTKSHRWRLSHNVGRPTKGERAMFAVYATHADPENPVAALKIGQQPESTVPDGWVRVKVSHASLNRHDLFTLQGISGHPEGIKFPMILGNDAAGTLDDGTPVVIYPLMGSDDWRGDETLDPGWHIPSEFIPGTFADYAVVPKRNAIPLPSNLSLLHASVLGTAWLTAYRALFTKSGLRPGDTILVQGATGGLANALIQLGRAAAVEVSGN